MNLDKIADAFGFDAKGQKELHQYATVDSENADGSYQVIFNGATETARAARLCNASAGDRVLCVIFEGQCAAVSKLGGETSLPSGGSQGQVLAKASATNYDVEWVNQSGGGGGGHTYELDGTDTTVRLTADGSANKGNAGTYTIPAASSSKAGTMSSTHYTKLEGIEAGAEVNVQSDWNATSGDAAILNKPTIPTVPSAYTSDPVMDGTASAGDATTWARGNHVHPTDTSRAAAVHTHAADAIVSGTLAAARGGVPTGGTAGQVLAKASNSDNDLEWVAQTGGSTGTPTALYNDATGTTGTVTLSASANNYSYMRIYYKKNGDSNACGSVDVYQPNGKIVSLVLVNPYDAAESQLVGRAVEISGTSITGYRKEAYENTGNGGVLVTTSTPSIAITRVEAWNVIPAVYPAAVQTGSNLAVE